MRASSFPDWGAPSETGHKFARLAELERAGFQVPAFFCVGASAFAAARSQIALDQGALPDEELRAALAGAVTRPAVADLVVEGLSQIGFGRVAVRSCLVSAAQETGEDSRTNPFAGVSKTVLGACAFDEVLDAIGTCWSSLYTPEVTAFVETFGFARSDLQVVVAVQRLVEARSSFVAFSRDPIGGADHTVIAATWGLGEGIVQSRAEADHFTVSASDSVEARLASKTHAVQIDPSGDVALVDVPPELVDRPSLDKTEVQAVADLASRIASLAECPQDIEGAIDANGVLWTLQTRPIVVPDTSSVRYTNLNISESFPGCSSPMSFAVAARFYELVFRDNYLRFGVDHDTLRREQETLTSMLGYVDHRVYYNLSTFYRLHSLSPLFPLIRKDWERKIGLTTDPEHGDGRSAALRLSAARPLPRIVAAIVRNNRNMTAFTRAWSQRLPDEQHTMRDLVDASSRVSHYRAVWADVGATWGVTLVNDTVANSVLGLCRTLLQRSNIANVDGVIADLLVPAKRTISDVFWDEVRNALLADNAPTDAEIAALVGQLGDQCLQGLKIEEAGLAACPDLVRDICSSSLDRPTPDATMARSALRGTRGLAVRLLARWLRSLICHRENHRFLRSQLYLYCRLFALGLGRDLVRCGALDDTGQVWFLTDEEAIGAVDGHTVDRDLRGLIALRQASMAEAQHRDPPSEFVAWGPLAGRRWNSPQDTARDADTVAGIGSCPGIARGRALVLDSPRAGVHVDRDTIVVARATDPSWVAIMAAAGGLVVERGSMLSHTAITGRLLRLPTVVSARDATARIATGALVEVDGGAGVARLIEEPAAEQTEAAM